MRKNFFKKNVACLALAALLTSSIFIPTNSTCLNAANEAKKQYIVITKDGMQDEVSKNYSEFIDNDTIAKFKEDNSSVLLNMSLTDSEAQMLKNDNFIASMELDNTVSASTDSTEESATNSDWNKKIIHVESEAQEINGSNKVKVALIDSGVDYTSDIPVVERMNFIPEEEGVSPIYDDPTGHGTSIAGIIASNGEESGVTGINPNVELYSAKILGFDMQAPISRVISAIDWAIEKKVHIINLSFGTTTDSPALHYAIQKAYNAGILIVAAAGNDETVEYPAAYDEVIAVGSIDSSGKISEDSASGNEIELVAPGEKVVSTSHFGGVSAASGTSLAAPHVVGIASLLFEKNLSVSSDFIRKVLDASANRIDDENACGYGLVDYDYATEIYNSMLADYEENKPIENYDVKDNEEEVISYDTDEIVEGRWSQADHENMTSEAAQNENLDTDYAILFKSIKAGSRANDKYVGGTGALTYAPQFHGWVYYGTNTSHVIDYVSCYIFMTDIAKYYYSNGSFPSTSSIGNYSYLDSSDATMMLNALNTQGKVTNPTDNSTASWSTIFSYYSLGSVTNARMCGFLYGMACHIATDTFAHSAYRLESDGTYSHILHDDGADLHGSSNVPERFDCATEIAQTLVSHYYNGNNNKQLADVDDFILASYTNVINNATDPSKPSFKLRKMKQFAIENGRAFSDDPYLSYFESMSY